MKRLTREEAAEWRRKSAEAYRARARECWETRRKPAGRAERPQEARKREQDAIYRENREKRLVRARGRCEFQVNPDMPTARCTRPATQTHHIVRRSHYVDHDVENLLAVCADHHITIHANVGWSKMRGYIRTDWPQLSENGKEPLIDELDTGA